MSVSLLKIQNIGSGMEDFYPFPYFKTQGAYHTVYSWPNGLIVRVRNCNVFTTLRVSIDNFTCLLFIIIITDKENCRIIISETFPYAMLIFVPGRLSTLIPCKRFTLLTSSAIRGTTKVSIFSGSGISRARYVSS